MQNWPPESIFHRQMYIDLIRAYLDLIRAYLPDYGSQRDLARALGISEVYLSLILEPVSVSGVYTSFYKTPSPSYLPPGKVEEALIALGSIHSKALYATHPAETQLAYAQVWAASNQVVNHIDPKQNTLQLAQVHLYAHDAACILGRPDAALFHARRAILVLTQHQPTPRQNDLHHRFVQNAYLAEVVALNNLNLPIKAKVAASIARNLPGYGYWKRPFLEQELSALKRLPRFSLHDVELVADQAIASAASSAGAEFIPLNVLQACIQNERANAYLAHGSPRSIRKARPLVESNLQLLSSQGGFSTLRQVLIHRTAADYFDAVKEPAMRDDQLRLCLRLIRTANLTHQGAELQHKYGPIVAQLQQTAGK
jgi:hypothetical protein